MQKALSFVLGAALAALVLAPPMASATVCAPNYQPPFVTGGSVFGYLASQWSSFFGGKVDINNGTACNLTLLGTNLSLSVPLSPANGGTGVNNGTNILTFDMPVTFSAGTANPVTFTFSGATTMAFPAASDTVVTEAAVQTLTNKVIDATTISDSGNLTVGGNFTAAAPNESAGTVYAGPVSGPAAPANFLGLGTLELTPSGGSQSGSLAQLLASQAFNVAIYGAVPSVSADQSAAINSAIAAAVTAGQGVVYIPPGTYGVCANPVEINNTTGKRLEILAYGVTLTLQTGCAVPPQEILYNNTSAANDYTNSTAIDGITVSGACTTKYAYYVNNGNQTTHLDDVFENPATAAAIAGSAGVYVNGGTELKLGSTNWVTATGSCYNTGNLPAYGVYHAVAGNADFTGLIVVNFQTGIYGGGDDFFGPGTHVWGGCDLQAGGGCVFNAALRATYGIQLNGSGETSGVEIDDPVTAGIYLVHVNANDRMVARDTDCIYSQTPTAGQSCVLVGSSVANSLVQGTEAPQIAAAGFLQNIVGEQSGVLGTTTIDDNPQASYYSGEAAIISMFGSLPASAAGCIGLNGYQAGTTSCSSSGWVVSPTSSCAVKSLTVQLSAAPGAGNSLTFTVLDDGVATPITVTISGASAFNATDSAHTATIGYTDAISLGVATAGGTPSATAARAAVYGCG